MSRHILRGINPAHRVTIGWDQPMLTFFLQVHDEAAEAELARLEKAWPQKPPRDVVNRRVALERRVFLHWVGTDPRELYDLDALKHAARKWVELTPDVLSALYGDRDNGTMNAETDWRVKRP